MQAEMMNPEQFKEKTLINRYIQNFHLFYRHYNSTNGIGISYVFLEGAKSVLHEYVTFLETNRKKNKGRITAINAHIKYCDALIQYCKDARKEAKDYLEEGLELFRKSGNRYNAEILEKQLTQIEKPDLKVPFVDRTLNFVFVEPNTENEKSSSITV